MAAPSFSTPPPVVPDVVVSLPRPHVLLVELNRPARLNAIAPQTHALLARLWDWYDAEPSLRCAVLCGRGRAFCVGADLKEWHARDVSSSSSSSSTTRPNSSTPESSISRTRPSSDRQRDTDYARQESSSSAAASGLLDHGFGGLSNRRGRKPIIAAIHGLCLGGGMEMALNADMLLSSAGARFGLPEVGVGAVAVAGGLPRLARIVGRQRASEMAMMGGKGHTAEEMYVWGLVNKVVKPKAGGKDLEARSKELEGKGRKPEDDERDGVVGEALWWAERVAAQSPDAVIVTREGILGAWDAEDPRASTVRVGSGMYARMEGGENMREGVASFVEGRRPLWRNSKL